MNAREQVEMEKLEELRKVIEASPLTQKIKEDRANETLIKRTLAKHEVDRLQKELEEFIPKWAEVEEMIARLKKLDDERRDLQVAINEKRASFSRRKLDIESEISQQQRILLESYDPIIDKTIAFFRMKLDWLRSPGRISSRGMKVERNLFTETKTLTMESNVDAVHEAILYCQAAIKELERMELSPELDLEKIEAIKDGIPSIEVYQEVTGKKPLPGSRGINPRDLLPSDSQMEWSLAKLNEKFQKWLRK